MTIAHTVPGEPLTRHMMRYHSARAIAFDVGQVLRDMQSQRLGLKTISKGGTDFATEADAKAEKNIVEHLKMHFPDDTFLAEESAPANYDEYASMSNLWIIDPLDGTTNYSLGEENYAISIAFVQKGKPQFGVIYQPARRLLAVAIAADEDDEAYTQIERSFEHGGRVNRPFAVSPETDPNKCTIGHNWSYTMDNKRRMNEQLARLIPGDFRAFVARSCAAGDLLSVADGRMHGYVQESLKPWDVAAAGLMVQLAGGKVTGIDGTPWHPFRHDILASNGHLHDRLVELLNG